MAVCIGYVLCVDIVEPEHSTSLMGRLRGVSEAIGLTSLHSTEMPGVICSMLLCGMVFVTLMGGRYCVIDFDASSKDPGRARRTYSGVFHSAEKEGSEGLSSLSFCTAYPLL